MFLLDEISLFVSAPFEFFSLDLMFLPKGYQQDPIAVIFLLVLIHISLEGDPVFDCHVDKIFLADWRFAGKLGDILLGELGRYLI